MRKLLKGGKYSRKGTIWGITVVTINRIIKSANLEQNLPEIASVGHQCLKQQNLTREHFNLYFDELIFLQMIFFLRKGTGMGIANLQAIDCK